MAAPTHTAQGVSIPWIFYGTAWKEDRTERLTATALASGFRAVDTANQRKHYVEVGVGAAVAASGIAREELFLQTKFTYARGQDHRLPYDPKASFGDQVAQSFARSLEHLRTSYVDSYVLHGPYGGDGIEGADREVWRAMEAIVESGKARLLGVSNVSLEQLRALYAQAEVKPTFVQNRCHARRGWDRDVRAFCREHGVLYQGFSLLTANGREVASPAVQAVAKRTKRSAAEVVFAFARTVGMIPLTGTSSADHMRSDLAAADLVLDASEVRAIESITA